MQLLPSGFALPPLRVVAVLLLAAAATGGLLYRRHPPVTSRVVAAFAPWMIAGATLYALYQVKAVPAVVRPLFGSPAVYVTTFIAAGLLWAAVADRRSMTWGVDGVPGILAVVGTTVAGSLLVYAVLVGLGRGTLSLRAPMTAFVGSVVLSAAVWYGIRDRLHVGVTGSPGVLVVIGHTLDGVSTALGAALGYAEQTPLSQVIIDVGAALPLPGVGGAWLFVVVKIALAIAVLAILADYIRERQQEGALLLGIVAAVGLGPGVHNLVLFAMTAG